MATVRPPRTISRLGVADALREIGTLPALEGASPFNTARSRLTARVLQTSPVQTFSRTDP
jgi:hypothetical protein